jgi:hypothetical protein
VRNLRMKIAAFALALGLGGLGGYAISSGKSSQGSSGVVAEGTKVVRRTVHAKRPKLSAKTAPPARTSSTRDLASEPVSTGSSGSGSSGSSSGRPVHTGSSGSSHSGGGGTHKPVNTGSSGSSGGGSSQPPVSTGSSGASGGATAGDGGEDGGESEVGDD